MSELEFPAGAYHVATPVGSEAVFATRASDGQVIYFLVSELLAGLVKVSVLNEALNAVLQSTQPREAGKGLSQENFTPALKAKLDSITSGGGAMTKQQILSVLGITDISGVNTGDQTFKTINNQTITGSGNLVITGGSSLPSDYWIIQNITGTDETVLNPKYLPYGFDLSPSQHEVVSDGIGIKGFANIGQGGGGNTYQPAMTSSMILDDDTANTRTLQNLGTGKTFADVETSINGGTSYTTHTSNVFNIGNVALAAGQVLSRFKTNGTMLAGNSIANALAYTVTSGSTNQPAMTSSMITDDDTANTRTLQNLPSGKTFADVETSVNGGTSYLTHTANAFAVGNIAAAVGQVLSRFKTNGSVLAGTPIANAVAFTVSGGGTPTVERTMRLNFQSQFSSPPTSALTWNNLKPTNAQLNAAAGFVSANLVTEANAATTVKVTNTTALGNGNAQVSGGYTTGLYPAEIANSGWEFNGNSNIYTLTLSGLNTAKYYSFLMASVSENGATDAALWAIGAKSATQSPYRNFGISGESEFTSTFWAKIINVQPDGSGNVAITFRATAGGWSKFISALIIQEYATAS